MAKLKFGPVGLAALGSLAAGGTASAMPAATPDALGRAKTALIVAGVVLAIIRIVQSFR
jgi:hypothetical protein